MKMQFSILYLFVFLQVFTMCICTSSAGAVETGGQGTLAAMFVHTSVSGGQMSISYYGLPDNEKHCLYEQSWFPMALVVLRYIRLTSPGMDAPGLAGGEKSSVLGITSSFLNQYLGDKMQLEFQADPGNKSGALVLKIGL